MASTRETPLYAVIRSAKDRIIRRWIEIIRREFPGAIHLETHPLIDRMPKFIDQLASALEENHHLAGSDAGLIRTGFVPVEHGVQRADLQSFTLEQILYEYAYLKRALLSVLEEERGPLSGDETSRIVDMIMTGMRESACAFVARVDDLRAETESQYRHLVHEAKDYAIFLISKEGIILTWNEGASRIKQYRPEEVVGRHYRLLYCPEDREKGRPELNIRTALQAGRYEEQWWRLRKDGTAFWADVVITPVCTPEGRFLGLSKIVKDLTQQKLTADALRKAKEQAESASEMKSTFVANMSHEIRTPLGAILGFADILSDADTGAEERRQAVEIIKKNGRVLTRLIDDILDISKIEAGKLEMQITEIPLVSTLAEITAYFEGRAKDKGLDLKLEYGEKLPEYIGTDPVRFRQILNNLIGNAVKFTDKGYVIVEVGYRHAEDSKKGAVEVTVKDTGPGIPFEQREKLFQTFSQADSSSTRRFGGTGLGLALSRRLARELGGDVELVDCPVEEGCVFKVSISDLTAGESNPSKDRILEPAQERPAFDGVLGGGARNKNESTHERSLKDRRILLVEDSRDNQMLIKKMLTRLGLAVDVACHGAEGVEMALKGNYDLVLMDVQMPVLDGNQATRKLRQLGFRAPIIALTAHAMTSEKEKSMNAGCDDYLTKPIDSALLKTAIERKLSAAGSWTGRLPIS